MQSEEASDITLWSRFKLGERKAFETLICLHYRMLFDYGQRFERDTEVVKDCIHDMFTHLWHTRENLSDTDAIKPYLLTSLRNRIFKEKQQSHNRESFDSEVHGAIASEGSVQDRIIASEESRLNSMRLNRLLEMLTSRQQEVVYLRYFQNLSNEQIAGIMQISKPAVANLLHSTLKLLKERWLVTLFSFFVASH